MLIWAYVYCAIFVIGGVFTLFDKDRLRKPYQPAGEILDCLCGVLVFLVGYRVLAFDNSAAISTLCIVYTFAWYYHAHKKYFDYQSLKPISMNRQLSCMKNSVQNLQICVRQR